MNAAKLTPKMLDVLQVIRENSGRVRTNSSRSYGYADGDLRTQREIPAVQMRSLIARNVLVYDRKDLTPGDTIHWFKLAEDFAK